MRSTPGLIFACQNSSFLCYQSEATDCLCLGYQTLDFPEKTCRGQTLQLILPHPSITKLNVLKVILILVMLLCQSYSYYVRVTVTTLLCSSRITKLGVVTSQKNIFTLTKWTSLLNIVSIRPGVDLIKGIGANLLTILNKLVHFINVKIFFYVVTKSSFFKRVSHFAF